MTRFVLYALTALTLYSAPTLNAQAVTCKDGTTAAKAGRGACSHHGGVASATASPRVSRAPAAPKVGESVSCRDGTTTNVTGRGACSHHGGVGAPAAAATTPQQRYGTKQPPTIYEPGPRTAAPAPSTARGPNGATAQCRDGTYSHSANRRGTCSHHGGVATWF